MKEIESSEQTIRRVLSIYEIGRKIRKLRLRRKRGLVELGKSAGLSPSLISQLENGKLIPTVATLARIASEFEVGLDYFFREQAPTFQITRGDDRMVFPEISDGRASTYFFEVLAFDAHNKTIQSYLAEFSPGSGTPVYCHEHDGSELVYVISGALEITFEGEPHILHTGDSVYFDGRGPHSYRGLSEAPAKALVITAPTRL